MLRALHLRKGSHFQEDIQSGQGQQSQLALGQLTLVPAGAALSADTDFHSHLPRRRDSSSSSPLRSLDMEELNAGHAHPRRYRNRRIGDFLKELDLTEGKATGIPTVIDEMTGNGSPMVEFTFDEERTWFMARIPVHPAFLTDTLTLKNSVSQSVSQGVSQSNSQPRTLSTKEKAVLKYCTEPRTSKEILEKIGVSYHSKNISRYITNLVADGFLRMTVPDNPKAKNQQYVKV